MKTKADFQNEIAASVSKYPTAAQFYKARDPRLLAMLDAMAAQLALISSEMETASMEPFTKSRDVTVLADASVKGVMPFGRPARVKLLVENASTVAVLITAGRRVIDPQGRYYIVDQGATVQPASTGFVTAIQKSENTFPYTVQVSKPFIKIPVRQPEGGRHIVSVRLVDSLGRAFPLNPDFVNVALGEISFHLETDETRALSIVFGAENVVGYQPSAGEQFTVTVEETDGAFDLAPDAPFAFEYSYSLYESGVTLKHNEMLEVGANPLDIDTIREITSFPSVYDGSAVYLGNFDFLIRRNLSPFRFLSVWNEQIEESVRGPSVDNINRLFVAAESDAIAQPALEASILKIINDADDSYRVSFVPVVDTPIEVTIDASVDAIFDFAVVEQQIREVVDSEYGPDSLFAKRGMGSVLYKRFYDLITSRVQALQTESSDLQISVAAPVGAVLPEHYRYISEASLTINIEQA